MRQALRLGKEKQRDGITGRRHDHRAAEADPEPMATLNQQRKYDEEGKGRQCQPQHLQRELGDTRRFGTLGNPPTFNGRLK